MASNTEGLQEAYKAFAEGDADKASELFADDAVWEGPNSTELPGGGEHNGKDAIVELLKTVSGEWDEFNLTPDEFFENEDTVVVLLHADVKKGDQSGQLPTVHIVRFEDDEIKRFQVLTDTLLSAQLLGLIGGKPPEGDQGSDDDEDDSKDDESKDDDSKDDESKDDDSKDDDSKDDESKDDESKDDDS